MHYSTVTPNGFGENGFTPHQVHHDPPPPNRAIHHHDYVQRVRQPIYNDYVGRHEERYLFVYA